MIHPVDPTAGGNIVVDVIADFTIGADANSGDKLDIGSLNRVHLVADQVGQLVYVLTSGGQILAVLTGVDINNLSATDFISTQTVAVTRNDLLRAGMPAADDLNGGGGNDLLTGGDGDDMLYGFAGEDVLIGGAGTDTLTGGDGDDTFVLEGDHASRTIADADVITDFTIVRFPRGMKFLVISLISPL